MQRYHQRVAAGDHRDAHRRTTSEEVFEGSGGTGNTPGKRLVHSAHRYEHGRLHSTGRLPPAGTSDHCVARGIASFRSGTKKAGERRCSQEQQLAPAYAAMDPPTHVGLPFDSSSVRYRYASADRVRLSNASRRCRLYSASKAMQGNLRDWQNFAASCPIRSSVSRIGSRDCGRFAEVNNTPRKWGVQSLERCGSP